MILTCLIRKIVLKMEKLRERIKKVLTERELSVNALAATHGVQQKTLNNQIKGQTAISASTVLILLKQYPDLSAEWLLRGTGSMLLTEPQHETLTREIREDTETIAALKETIAAQKIAIAALTDEVHVLKGDIVVPHRSVETA